VLSGGFSALAVMLGSAVGCYELPSDVIIMEESWGGEAWGGEGSSDDDGMTGGSANGGTAGGGDAGSSGSATGGAAGSAAGSGATGGAGTGGESTAGSGGKGGAAGASSGGSSAGGRGGTGGSGGRAGSGGKAGGGGTSGASSAGSGGSAGFSTNRDEFFGASRCSSAFELCDDFEATTLNTTRWRVQGPAPTIDSTRAARGMRSVHFRTTDNGLSLIHATSIFPATNNTYWGRLFVWFDSMPTAPMWAHWTIVGAIGSGTEAEVRLGGQYDGDSNRFGVGTDHGPTGDWTTLDDDPGDPVPVDSWVCIEWLHKGDTDETRFFWDGVEHPSLHTSPTEHGGPQSEDYVLPEFEDVFVGWWLYQAGTTPPAFDVWIDEVALDGERIGCSR
jgi:hypothetical protein